MDTMRQSDGRLGEEALLDVYRPQSISFAPPQTPVNYGSQFMAQSWPPQPSSMWAETYSSHFNWQSQEVFTQENALYTSEDPNLGSPQYKYEPAASFPEPSYPQPYAQPINHVSSEFRTPCPPQTPQTETQPLYTNVPTSDGPDYSHPYTYGTEFPPPMSYDAAWLPIGNETGRSSIHATSDPLPDLNAPETSSKALVLDWPISDQAPTSTTSISSYQAIVPKRKHASPEPVAKKNKSTSSQDELDEFVVVFENAPGALASVKRRRKLDAPVRKAARDVRKAGACHQCRFRKRTCSTGTPCTSCLKNGNGLHELKCQRESPFVGQPMHQYFEYSSTRRVVSFDIRINSKAFKSLEKELITIDGVGHLSHTIQLPARRKPLNSFKADEREVINRTRDSKKLLKAQDDELEHVLILEDEATLGTQVEQWAVEYSSKFVHAAGPEFASTTAAVILGTAYVNKGLPESALVAAMLRVASLAFILRAGVKCTPATSTSKSSSYRTVQASIDTILYERLKIAERDLFQMLQRLVFRSAGYLNREQVYPVALVLWQLLRILCIGASHLSNLVQRFRTKAREQASYQFHALKLVLSTHLALFRSSNPLLLDFNNKVHQDLLGGHQDLIKLAIKMRKVVVSFREKGFTDMKGSIAYRKEYFDLFRRVYDGL
ncbi:hypothetical protein N431DRAFT_545182 [Stipitochalara longipes BDJ]|nr:hypothetical protein N431DRAFT_545182 [Stipitochalara longipes BDJ]